MTIKAVLACDEDGGIGKDNSLPWPRNSEDLKYFKSLTTGHPVIMGSSTFESLGNVKPLPNRVNVVVSTKPDAKTLYPEADIIIPYFGMSLTESVRHIESEVGGGESYIIGGGQLIHSLIDIIDTFYLTTIPGEYDCDTFLPNTKLNNDFNQRSCVEGNSGNLYLTLNRKIESK